MMNGEFLSLFYRKLSLGSLDMDTQTSFIAIMTKYLDHGRKDEINGRTVGFVAKQLDVLIKFLNCIGYSNAEMVKILMNLPSLLNTGHDLYVKYLFLGVVENKENTLRRDKLLNKTKDFMVGLPKIYARYRLIQASGYCIVKWNSLVHASDKEFASIFVKGVYEKPYQMFESVLEVYEWLKSVSMDELDVSLLKGMSVNKELVMKYEGMQEENRRKL